MFVVGTEKLTQTLFFFKVTESSSFVFRLPVLLGSHTPNLNASISVNTAEELWIFFNFKRESGLGESESTRS